jgi:hypothetical protein
MRISSGFGGYCLLKGTVLERGMCSGREEQVLREQADEEQERVLERVLGKESDAVQLVGCESAVGAHELWALEVCRVEREAEPPNS